MKSYFDAEVRDAISCFDMDRECESIPKSSSSLKVNTRWQATADKCKVTPEMKKGRRFRQIINAAQTQEVPQIS
jgi:hypothetical protein